MNADKLHQVATIAQLYNESDAWSKDSFRFKNHDNMGKSELFPLRNGGLIQDTNDGFSTTTWEWTDGAREAISLVEESPITKADEGQLSAFREHGGTLLELPHTETFLAREYGMIGQSIQTLSSENLIEQVDTEGQLGVWQLTQFAVRMLTALEAAEIRHSGNANSRKVLAD